MNTMDEEIKLLGLDKMKEREDRAEVEAKHILMEGNPLEFISRTIALVHVGDTALCRLDYLAGLTPVIKGAEPLHVMHLGRSGKGKSDGFFKVLKVFPPNSYYMLTSLSPKALLYATKAHQFDGKVIFIDEGQATEESVPVLRSITASGGARPRHWSVDTQSKEKHVELSILGNYSVFMACFAPIKDDQLLNRFILGNPDEGAEQDDAVHRFQKKSLALTKEAHEPFEFEVGLAITRILRENRLAVAVPFIDQIDFPNKENRRNFPFFITLLKAVAFVNQFQRVVANGVVLAARDDFETAKQVWDGVSPFQTHKVSQTALKVYACLSTAERMTRNEVADAAGIPMRTAVHKLEDELFENGWVSKEKVERQWVYWKQSDSGLPVLTAQVDWASFTETELAAFLSKHLPDYQTGDVGALLNSIRGNPPQWKSDKSVAEANSAFKSESEQASLYLVSADKQNGGDSLKDNMELIFRNLEDVMNKKSIEREELGTLLKDYLPLDIDTALADLCIHGKVQHISAGVYAPVYALLSPAASPSRDLKCDKPESVT